MKTCSVIISSRNRSTSLERMFASLYKQAIDISEIEIIVVDNASTDNTSSVITSWKSLLPIESLKQTIPSKSRSLNTAIDAAQGSLLVFTDDDTSFSLSWLEDLISASVEYTNASVFCGPIVTDFPDETPALIMSCKECHGLYGAFSFPVERGLLPRDVVPFGANYAVRKQALGEVRFREDLGPSLEHGPNLGEDTDLIRRVKGGAGQCVYIPSAAVTHHINKHQVNLDWIKERAFYLGKSYVYLCRQPDTQYPVLRVVEDLSRLSATGELVLAVALNYLCGQLSVLVTLDLELADTIRCILRRLRYNALKHLLGSTAQRVFQQHVR